MNETVHTSSFSLYQALALRTAKMYDELPLNLTHAALGIATENGEFTTIVKRMMIYEKAMTVEMKGHMLEELGDILWYVALAASHLGEDLGEIAQNNIDKLRMRFPDKYSDAAAESRADKGGLDARAS